MHGRKAPEGWSGCTSIYRHEDGRYQAARFREVEGRWALLALLGEARSKYSQVAQVAGNLQDKEHYPYLKPKTKKVKKQQAEVKAYD